MSVKAENNIYNLGIIKENNFYKWANNVQTKPFKSIQEMVSFYLENPLYVTNGNKPARIYIRNLLLPHMK